METGKVVFFHDKKKFGFVEGEDKIFFHLNDGGITETNKKMPYLTFVISREKQEPKEGDLLLFIRGMGEKGEKAKFWWIIPPNSYLFDKQTKYRLKKFFNVPGDKLDEEKEGKILWEGNDLTDLITSFPRKRGDNFSCDDFDEWQTFERLTQKGWEVCDDPRPLFSMEEFGKRKIWTPH